VNGAGGTSGAQPGKKPLARPDSDRRDEVLLEEIACAAFEGWNQAGRPAGRLAGYWNKAYQRISRAQKAKAGANGSPRRGKASPARIA
jgi:hypothetical protein